MSKQDGYFVVTSGEDGTRIEGPMTAAQLRVRITPDKHGDTYDGCVGFHERVPDNDGGYWSEPDRERKRLVIKGEIVVPMAKTIAVEFEIP